MEYRIIDGADNMKLEDIQRLLKMTYWADKRSPETVKTSVKNASCYGIYLDEEKKLVGFARVISDYATTFYLADVIIDPDYQSQGLGTAWRTNFYCYLIATFDLSDDSEIEYHESNGFVILPCPICV